MKNETLIKNNVEFACDLADILLELDGWGAKLLKMKTATSLTGRNTRSL